MKTDKEKIEVMQARQRGDTIERLLIHGTGRWEEAENPIWNWANFDYRIVSAPKLRAWRPEEVPMPCVLRNKTTGHRYQVLSVVPGGLFTVSGGLIPLYPFRDLVASSEHSIDGGKTWLPCGVLE
jgi:hypothetical protein